MANQWASGEPNERSASFLSSKVLCGGGSLNGPVTETWEEAVLGQLEEQPWGEFSCQNPPNTTIQETALPYLWPLSAPFLKWCWGSGRQGTPLGDREVSMAVLFPDIPTTGSEGLLPPPTPCPRADASPVLSAAEQLSGVCIIYLLCNIYWDLVFNNCHSNISFLNPFRSAAVAI